MGEAIKLPVKNSQRGNRRTRSGSIRLPVLAPVALGIDSYRAPFASNIFYILIGVAAYGIYIGLVAPLQTRALADEQHINLGLAFVTGLLTSAHCVSMCGGMVLACGRPRGRSNGLGGLINIRYALAKTLSYTTIGAACGAVGKAMTFTSPQRGMIAICFGLILLVSNVVAIRWPDWVRQHLTGSKRSESRPIVIGLLNGGMIVCGPLFSLYLIAAATCSPTRGGVLLLVFGLGTLPALLGMTALMHWIGRDFQRYASRFSQIAILLFSLNLINNGLILTGTQVDIPLVSINAGLMASPPPDVIDSGNTLQVIHMHVTSRGWTPSAFVLRRGVPVRWIINGDDMSQCTREIEIPAMQLSIKLHAGANVVEFTPHQAGNIMWSCWMGMAQGNFWIIDANPNKKKN